MRPKVWCASLNSSGTDSFAEQRSESSSSPRRPVATKLLSSPLLLRCLPRTMEAGGDAEPAQAVPATARDWAELPLDAIASVFARLGPVEILMGAGLVCRSWLHAAEGLSSPWKHLDMASSHNVVKDKCRSGDAGALRAMARKAVDRSAGQLEVFVGEEFVDDDLLKYIGGRAPSLKVLRLISCFHIRNEGFVEAISKFPLLEELNLST
ncbi:hypothetical protein PVAP13_6KG091700 [Panicum virgatum]|nr:hypothetical protein PVAP13_6KG091700 [Panicum virgatum]